MQTVHRAAWKNPDPQLPAGAGLALPAQPTTLESLNFKFLIVFLFIIFSRVFDVKFYWLHIPGITYRFLALLLLLTGAFAVPYRTSIGKCVLGFTTFFLLSIPFSVWRGGSFEVLNDQWLVAWIVFTATAALVHDLPQYMRAAKTVAIAIVVLTVICRVFGVNDNGRLFLDSGRFSNPNEMAQALLLGMPFVWAVYANARSAFAKAAGILSLLAMLYVISKTGSRGALISIAVIVACMFLRASLLGKIKVAAAAGLLLVTAAFTLSGDLKTRYQTFFSDSTEEEADAQVDQGMLQSAVASTDTREQMFRRSVVMTLQHPLLGVGAGMFAVAENDMARAEGKRKGAWVGTHNSFTEVSSECGIPAFLFYAGIVVISFKKSYRLYRQTKHLPQFREISTHALALHYSLMAFIVTGMFIHAAYTSLLPVLAGLTVSLVRTAGPVLAAAAESGAPAPVAVEARGGRRMRAVSGLANGYAYERA